MRHNSHLQLVAWWGLCCTLPALLAACWVDFPVSRLNRDGRTDWPYPTDQATDQPVVPPGDGPREAARDLGPSPDHPLRDFRTEGFTCTPNAFLACVNGDKDLEKCNPTGDGKVTITCGPPGKCSTGNKRCDVCDPSTAPACLGTTTVRTCSADGLWVDTPCPNGGTCQAGKCCTATDGDADGYTTCTGDCNDGNKDVHPGQTGYFTAAISGTGSYDYDCSGAEEKQWTAVVSCQVSGGGCIGHGWATAAPACGQGGTWKTCDKTGSSCTTTDSSRTQACH